MSSAARLAHVPGQDAQRQVAAPVWTTPEILKTGVAAIWIASVFFVAAGVTGARSHRHAIQVVGKDSAPSIIAAQHIRTALANMDANAMSDSRDAFEKSRTEAVAAIVAAAENITYGDAERKPIHALALGMSTYTALAQAARDRRDMAAWRAAWSFMDTTLLPAAADLDKANRTALDEAYGAQTKASGVAMAMLILSAVFAGLVLIGTQVFLNGRMRRMINPLLFLATMAALVFVIYTGQRFRAADRDLKIAKEDAFESIHSLWQARALAYSANGDLNRAAFDTAQRAVYDADFVRKTETVQKHIADERNNITFAGEDEAAKKTSIFFDEFKTRRTPAAFTEFDAALGETLKVNQDEFDKAVARGFADVASFEIIAPVWAVAISLLAWLGLRPRIREYSA